MIIFFQELVMYIILELLKMTKGICDIYLYILGIKDIENTNKEPSLLEQILNNLDITNIYFCFILIGLLIGAILIIISIIKNNKQITTIIGSFISSIISIFVTTIIVLILVKISNSFLNILVDIFGIEKQLDIAEFILQNSIVKWNDGLAINDIEISDLTLAEFLGTYKFESYQVFPTQWNNNGIVNTSNFLFIPCLITTLITLISLLYITIKIIKRIYEIVLLYIIMPIILFTINIDNGVILKVWSQKLINQMFITFIIFLSTNIFYIIFSLLINHYLLDTMYNKNLYNLIVLLGGIVFLVVSLKYLDYSNKINISDKFKTLKHIKHEEVTL